MCYGGAISTGRGSIRRCLSASPCHVPDLRQYRIALGPVAVFGASNFPLAFSTAGGDTASALAAGCPVVFKAHSGHMATAERVADAIIRAAEKTAMPAGVFNMIYGGGVGEALVKHPAIQAVGFTGSLAGGRALCDMAAARSQPIPVFAEMSSINPVIVLPQALASAYRTPIARDLTASVVQGCGQFCTNPGLVIGIRSPQFSAFVQQLAGRDGRSTGADHAQRRHPGQLWQRACKSSWLIPASSTWRASRNRAIRRSRNCSRPM